MVVGICRIAISGWLSSLDHLKVYKNVVNYNYFRSITYHFSQIFPMACWRDRYVKLFLFEVEILCDNHSQVCGPFTRYLSCTTLSSEHMLEANKVSNLCLETVKINETSELTNCVTGYSPLLLAEMPLVFKKSSPRSYKSTLHYFVRRITRRRFTRRCVLRSVWQGVWC